MAVHHIFICTNLSNGYGLFHQGNIKWDSCDSYFGNVFGGYCCGERSDGPKLLSGGLFGKKGGALAMYGVTPARPNPSSNTPLTHYYLEGAYNHLGPESPMASKHYGGCK